MPGPGDIRVGQEAKEVNEVGPADRNSAGPGGWRAHAIRAGIVTREAEWVIPIP